MNSDIEDIKSRLNILEVLQDYIRLDKAGANYRALCPFHHEKSPSFMVSEEKQIWHCFGCQKGGDIFGFVMEIEGLEFKEALKILAEKAGVELLKSNPARTAQKNKTLEILELAAKFYEIQLWKGEGTRAVLPYLRERGLIEDSIRSFRLGYAPRGWRNILQFLIGRGYTVQDIEKTGVLVNKNDTSSTTRNSSYDRFRDRVMFPIADSNGKVVGFSARVAPGGDESQAKYINTPETEVYHKSKVLYGIDKAKSEIREKGFTFLVEGNMDVIASYQAGIPNTVAVSGTALTSDQIALLKRYANKVKMGFDMDSAGEGATKKSIKLCFEKEMSVEVVELPEGKDAADLARKDPGTLKKAVEDAREAMEYFFNKVLLAHDPGKAEGKKMIVEELLDMISFFSNAIEKSHWVKKLGETLEIETYILTDMLKQATLKKRMDVHRDEKKDFDKFPSKGRTEVLQENLAGLMLAYGAVWKEVAQKEEYAALLTKDRLLSILIQAGQRASYEFENFLREAPEREIAAKAEKLYFEKKYRLDLNNQLEEAVIDDPLKEARYYLGEIYKETKKEELEKIIQGLKVAEDTHDKETAALLRAKCKEISEELRGSAE